MVQIPEKVLAKMAEQTTVKTLVTASACGAPHAIVCGSIIAPAADKVVVGEVLMKRASANLQANPKVRLFHNQNDLLLRDGDLDWLQRIFAGRAVIFPRCGHLGNLTVPAVRKAIVGVTLAP